MPRQARSRWVRSSGAAFAGVVLAALVVAVPTAPVGANTTPIEAEDWIEAARMSGFARDPQDNTGAALAWSAFTFESADEVLIGRADVFADSLAGAGAMDGGNRPLLLTPADHLDDRVAEEIERLGASTVHILGGESALSEDVADELTGLGYEVTRTFGATRVETAIEIAESFAPDADTAIIARGFGGDDPTQAFADSLAAGAWVAAEGWPVLLTETEVLTPETAEHLLEGGYTDAFVIGGESAISPETFEEIDDILDGDVTRVSGPTRFDTAINVARERGFDVMGDPIIVDGTDPNGWADGFPAAAQGAIGGSPVILTDDVRVPAPTIDFLLGSHPDFGIICGPSVPTSACDDAETASHTTFKPFYWRVGVLTADQEVPSAGDADASGISSIFITSDPDALCFRIGTHGLEAGEASAAHIHRGEAGAAGPIEVTLPLDATMSGFAGCVDGLDEDLVFDIHRNFAQFYVNVHTPSFPSGAIRGQLFDVRAEVGAIMTGGEVVPGPGAPEGLGLFTLYVPPGGTSVCGTIDLIGLDGVTGVRVARGGTGSGGPAVGTFPTPPPFTPWAGCMAVPADVVPELASSPGNFHVNVLTSDFPGGAIRGQLFDPFAG